ncbi:MAG TPA: hypothetical protein VF338_04570 [Leptolinea sp.]
MSKIDAYRQEIKTIKEESELRSFLLSNSNLPGPRGNLELAYAAAEEIHAALLIEWTALSAADAPVNSALEFLTFCGVLGQGRLYNEGDARALDRIIHAASDSRWRTREAAANALQQIGKKDIVKLTKILPRLANGNQFEQRCAVAAICEPSLLVDPVVIHFPLQLLDLITTSFSKYPGKKEEGYIALKKGLAYGWSVAAAANLDYGKPKMEKWLQVEDKDVRRVMQENLKKNRLIRLDEAWVNKWKK